MTGEQDPGNGEHVVARLVYPEPVRQEREHQQPAGESESAAQSSMQSGGGGGDFNLPLSQQVPDLGDRRTCLRGDLGGGGAPEQSVELVVKLVHGWYLRLAKNSGQAGHLRPRPATGAAPG